MNYRSILSAAFLLGVLVFAAPRKSAPDPYPDLQPARLEALHQKRVEWMKNRRVDPPHGVYLDLRIANAPGSVLPFRVQELAKAAGVQVLLTDREPRLHNGVLWMQRSPALPPPPEPSGLQAVDTTAAPRPKAKELKRLLAAFRQFPVEFAGLTSGAPLLGWLKLEPGDHPLGTVTRHVLARELSDQEVRKSLEEGRTYEAHDWLCDTAGFAFWASNNQGVFEIGDRYPIQNNTRIEARLPVPGFLRLYRGETLVQEAEGAYLRFDAKQAAGAYRLEADLDTLGTRRPWIRTQPIHLTPPEFPKLPNLAASDPAVEAVRNITYIDSSTDPKHKLDLYFPKGKTNVPIFVFIHGGSWASGDRSTYAPIGVMFAKRGFAVAIPSYRLMPKDPHPAQIDDVAAAFAWVAKNIGRYGVVDPNRIYLGGHSAGGHLSSLLALDKSYLNRHGVDPGVIRGVAALSGVYDLRVLPQFGSPEDRRKASPLEYVRKDAPPFLVTYCQWDYLSLPQQAKDLAASLKRSFVPARLVYVPGQTHITEVLSMLKDGDLTTEAIIRLLETGQP